MSVTKKRVGLISQISFLTNSDRKFLSDLLGQMKVYYFNDVSFDFLAERFYLCFRLEGTVGSFCTEMKVHDSDYSDCIKHFLNEINKINNKNKK